MTDRLIVWLGHDIAGALVRPADSDHFRFEAADDGPAITMADAGRGPIWTMPGRYPSMVHRARIS